MVHALEQIHFLLKGNGRLIDIHPPPEPPPIFVRLGADRHPVGWVREADDYCEYAQADDALDEVVARGLYRWEQRGRFAFVTYADSIADLQTHLAETWNDAIIEDRVIQRTEELMASIEPDKEVILHEVIQIARLRMGNR
ncbi:MAG: hypothetical protein WBO48_01400 [Candidatus Promineifilaceae bacterium]|nr:hypothetical protein [Chloroflexota bacterium]